MSKKRKIELYSAGCPALDDTNGARLPCGWLSDVALGAEA
jgi:hypothetical protein